MAQEVKMAEVMSGSYDASESGAPPMETRLLQETWRVYGTVCCFETTVD